MQENTKLRITKSNSHNNHPDRDVLLSGSEYSTCVLLFSSRQRGEGVTGLEIDAILK